MVEIVFDDAGTLIPVLLDAAPEETHRAGAVATEQEVERGVAISDHVRPERRVLTLTIVLTDSGLLGGNIPGSQQALALPSGASAMVFTPDDPAVTHVRDTWAKLIDARDRALLATITTRIETLSSMALIDIETTRTAANGTWIEVELSFAEIRTVSTELVDVPTPVRARDQAERPAGAQAPQDASPQLESLAHSASAPVGRALVNLLGRL